MTLSSADASEFARQLLQLATEDQFGLWEAANYSYQFHPEGAPAELGDLTELALRTLLERGLIVLFKTRLLGVWPHVDSSPLREELDRESAFTALTETWWRPESRGALPYARPSDDKVVWFEATPRGRRAAARAE